MAVITHVQRRSRLASMIDKAGGVSVGAALAQARENLAALEGEARAIIDARIEELTAMAAGLDGDEAQRIEQAYRTAAAMLDAAGPFGMDDLCQAAISLCDLLDEAPRDRPYDWRIVTVHAQSMRLLLPTSDTDAQARAIILDNLRQVRDRRLKAQAQDQPQTGA